MPWHLHANCLVCDWRFDGTPGNDNADLAARKHEKEMNHSTVTGMHRLSYCTQLGCPKPPES